jgi:excisionase family DNA binding protein
MTNSEIHPHSFLSVAEVAELFRIDRSHVYNAVKAGTLKHGKFGKVIRIHRDDALNWFRGEVAA